MGKRRRRGRKRKRRGGVKRMVKRMIARSVETKRVSETFDELTVDIDGQNYILVEIEEGTGEDERIGNRLRLIRMKLKGVIKARSDGAQSIVRIVLFIPKVIDSLISTNVDVYDMLDYDKFTVLSDKLYCVDGTAGPGCRMVNLSKSFNRGIRKGLEVIYNGPLKTQLTKNRLAFYIVSDASNVVGSPKPTFTGWVTSLYKDA